MPKNPFECPRPETPDRRQKCGPHSNQQVRQRRLLSAPHSIELTRFTHGRSPMHRSAQVCLIALVPALAMAAAPAGNASSESSQTQVTLKRLLERRELAVEKTPFSGWETGVELTLHVDGPGVAGARKFGHLKLLEA